MARSAIVLATLLAALPAAAEPARFALVIGNDLPLPDSDYEPLSYADDDAFRFAELMRRMGAKVILLATPDALSGERFGELADRAAAPTRRGVLDSLLLLEDALERAEGRQRELFFFFSGHGSMTAASAYLHLLDAPFSRTDLYELVLDRLKAERKHIIIDSCHSYFLAHARGERVPAEEIADLRRYPEAGFLLSTSTAREVHEWDGYEAGVFSYQITGALAGAADVDGDGVVTYTEVRAYLAAANLKVSDRARIQPFVRAPLIRGPELVDLSVVSVDQLVEVPESVEGRFHLTDARGSRILDANKPAGQPLLVWAPSAVELSTDHESFGVRHRGAAPALLVATSSNAIAMRPRGVIADSYRSGLFRQTLTKDFLAGLLASEAPNLVGSERRTPWYQDPVTIGALGIGGAGLVTGTVFGILFADAAADAAKRPVTEETELSRSRAEDRRAGMIAGLAAGVALAAFGLARALSFE